MSRLLCEQRDNEMFCECLCVCVAKREKKIVGLSWGEKCDIESVNKMTDEILYVQFDNRVKTEQSNCKEKCRISSHNNNAFHETQKKTEKKNVERTIVELVAHAIVNYCLCARVCVCVCV